MSHGKVAAVGKGCLDQLVLNTQVLKTVVEVSVGHVDGQLLQHIRFLGVKVESHLGQPIKRPWVVDLVVEQHAGGVPLVHQLRDLMQCEIKDKVTSLNAYWVGRAGKWGKRAGRVQEERNMV